jgi:hypothetical protein
MVADPFDGCLSRFLVFERIVNSNDEEKGLMGQNPIRTSTTLQLQTLR